MTDEEWTAYHRAVDQYERLNGVYGPMRRPWPPSRLRQPQATGLQVVRAMRSGILVRDAGELRRRFCDWRQADAGKVTRVRFAECLGVSDRTLARYCADYRVPWKALKRIPCEPDWPNEPGDSDTKADPCRSRRGRSGSAFSL